MRGLNNRFARGSKLKDSLDDQIVELWKELNPSTAYTLGWNEFAGRLAIPSKQNIQQALKKIRELRSRTENELQEKILDGMEVGLEFNEPQPVLDDILNTIFNHLTKEGVNEKHLLSLLSYASMALDSTSERFKLEDVPIAVKALTLYRLDGVMEILDAVKQATKSKKLKAECQGLKEKAKKFVAAFKLDGFGNGTFEEVEKIFKKHGFDLGRKGFYPVVLKTAFDYYETPEELENKALLWLDEELPKYRAVLKKLANYYECEATTEAVEKKIVERNNLKPKDLIKVVNSIRTIIQRFVDRYIVNINKKYRTKVIETPSYLTAVLPTAAAGFFDTFTKNPFQLHFITTDPKRDPAKSVSQLIDLLVHEEYGHCVHHSNSALRHGGNASPLELISTTHQGPITEGLSFNREREFLEMVKKLEGKTRLTKIEKEYVSLMGRYGGLRLVNLELELEIRKWRLIRFLRVIGDVRINSGKQGLIEFIDWAHAYTGVPRSNMFYQLFPAHEGIFPGYATCYAVVGEEIRSLEEKIKDDNARVRFSTYLTGIGYPPRSIYRRKLEDFVARLKIITQD
jgi:hypothetical protein